MDLLDRYLQAIRRNLPADKAGDIAAELEDELRTRIEDREDRLARPLRRGELSALLKAFGHPIAVAARYRGDRWLIGPRLYPFYLWALRMVLLVVLGVIGIAALIDGFANNMLLGAGLRFLAQLWPALFNAFGAVTLLFVLLDRVDFDAERLLPWRPEDLPALGEKKRGNWESPVEIALGIAVIAWWLGLFHMPILYTGARDVQVAPAPIWNAMWWPVLAVLVLRLASDVIGWLRPRWKLLYGAATLAAGIAGVGLLGYIYRAGEWAIVTGRDAGIVGQSLNLALGIAIVVVAVIWALQCLNALWRIARGRALMPFLA